MTKPASVDATLAERVSNLEIELAALQELKSKRYSIDQAAGTITLIIDPDIHQEETIRIDDLVELLFWLKSRESVLRRISYEREPFAIRKHMTLVNGFYIGCTADRRPVKITLESWNRVLEQERTKRKQRLAEAAAEKGKHAVLDRLELSIGMERRHVESSIDVDLVIEQELLTCRTPEFWVDLPQNMDSSKFLKLP